MLKIFLIYLGTIALGVGIIGIFVPGLPTTPFLLLTAGLYVRSSEKLYCKLINNKYIGHYITDYQKYNGITLRTKIYSVILMWAMIVLSVLFFINHLFIKIVIIGIGIIGSLVMGYIVPTISRNNKNQ